MTALVPLPPNANASSNQLSGALLVLLSAAAIAVVPTAARLAFEAGSNTLTVVTLRGVIGVALMAAVTVISRQSFSVPRAALLPCIAAGLAYALMSYGFVGSVAYIPVSLAVLVYFTHPLLLAVLAHRRGIEPLTSRKLGLGLAVLTGLALALGPALGGLDAIGVGLAAVASVAVCAMILFSARAQRHATSTQVNLHMTAVTVIVFVAVTTTAGAWSFPTSMLGWLGVAVAGVGVTVGLLAFFAAFRFIGPVRATMISNVEPLLGILVAVAVLGERFSPAQWAGVGVVVAALVLFEAPVRRRPLQRPE